ncbi:MAG TPA: TonB-dependent receptor [Terriglobales bacterium]|nr:TonB-dependent receptor [Terriglobales bacterium]
MVLAVVALARPSLSQERRGTISGHVTDSSDGILQGAKVELQPLGVTAITDGQGYFFMTGVDPGNYTIEITYVGFAPFTKKIDVSGGQVTTVDTKLAVSSQNLEVLVTADRASGEAEEVNRQRTADNVLQVLTNDVITSLPNANIADAVGRLPSVTLERDEGEGKYVQVRGTEPRLTNGTIDGVNIPSPESGVRQIKFDAIPADIVESVEINKTLQANMDADGIGGSVNLVTKTATERPTVSIFGMGGIIPIQGGRNNYTTTATVGKRFGVSKKFGLLGGFSYDWEGRGIDDVEPVPDIATLPGGTTERFFDSMDVREYAYYRSRYGAVGSADYQLGNGSNVYLRGLYSLFHNFGDRWVYTLNDNTQGVQLLNSNGCATDANGFTTTPCMAAPSSNNSIRRPRYTIENLVLGGKHELTNTWIAWDVSGSFASENDNGYGGGSFGVPFASTYTSPACTFDPTATGISLRPRWSQACYTEAYNPNLLDLNDVNISRGKTAQTNMQAAGAIGRRYHLGSHLATLEIGGKFRNAHKYDHSYADDYAIPTVGGSGANKNDFLPSSAIIPLSQFQMPFHNPSYYDGTYPLGPFANYYKTQAYAFANPSQFVFTTGAAGAPNFYQYVEQISAGYLMNTLNFSKFRFIAGVRVEGTNLDATTWDNQTNTQSLKAGGDYVKVLPSASLRYALTSNDDFRLVYSRGMSRPDPQDIAQSFSITAPAGGGKGNISFGNPNLAAETANNYDLLFEHYMNTFGAIQAGVFFKSLYDPIIETSHTVQNFTPPPPYNTPAYVGSYIISQPLNAGAAHLYGFEIAYLQHFSALPGWLSGFGLSANYSYTDSGTEGLPGRSDHPHLLRQAPNTWNISPTFDKGRFSYRLGLSYNQANIFSYQYQDGTAINGVATTPTPGGVHGPDADTYLYTHFQVDMQGSVRLEKGLTFIGAILNTNNEVFGFYNGSTQYLIQREFYKPTYSVGLRWTPFREKP